MDEIVPHTLFLSDYSAALDLEELDRNGILTVVNITDQPITNRMADMYASAGIRHYYLPCEDHPQQDIQQYFPVFLKIMQDAPKPVLVHCRAGISRSATLAILFVMHYYREPVNDAFLRVRRKRPIIEPNHGFMKQLRNWKLPEIPSLLATLQEWIQLQKEWVVLKKATHVSVPDN